MNAVFVTVLPVFSLIGLGYLAALNGNMPEKAAKSLGQFVFLFAIPALLFKTMVELELPDTSPWMLWAAFFVPAAIIWTIGAVMARGVESLKPKGGAVAAVSCSFGNLLMLGLPLVISHFGPEAALPAALIIAIHTPAHWIAAMLLAELSGRRSEEALGKAIVSLLWSQLRHPITASVIIGLLWSLTGIGIHPVADKIISMLGDAAIPAALFALGLSLAQFGLLGDIRGVSLLLVLKMIAFPVVAAILLATFFTLPPVWAGVVLIFAALPAGANAYLFAQHYDAGVGVASSSIAIGTVLSVVTVSVLLSAIGGAS